MCATGGGEAEVMVVVRSVKVSGLAVLLMMAVGVVVWWWSRRWNRGL